MTLNSKGKFKPKIGQLVAWPMQYNFSGELIEHLGLITYIFPDGLVEVTFLKNNWIITLQTKHLRLLNDVASTD
jgi:hypothetical protein